MPTQDDIAQLEQALPLAITDHAEAREMSGIPPRGWARQYVGVVRDDRRFIYGNFFPLDPTLDNRWREGLIVVCDGGPDYFGVEYDIDRKKFSHLAFNGP